MWWLVLGALGAMGLAAIAPIYAVLLTAVIASGVVQAVSNPVTNRLAAQWIPNRRRGVVIGVKQSGVQMTQAAAGLALPTLAILTGWRGAVAIAAGTLLVLGVVLLARYLPPSQPAPATPVHTPRTPIPRSVWWLAGYSFTVGMAVQGVNFHIALFGFEDLQLRPEHAGLLAAVIGLVGIAARIGWGQGSGWLSAHAALAIAAVGGAVAMALIWASTLGLPNLVWVGAALMGATGVAANVVVMVTVVGGTPAVSLGRAWGLVALGMYLGFAAGPVGVGALVDAGVGYPAAWVALGVIYLAATLLVLGYLRSSPTTAAR